MADIEKELNDIKNAVYGKEVRGSIHDGIKKINDEVENATDLSESAKHQVENIQQQVNQLVVEGDSSVEAAQARVDEKGVAHPTLKARIDDGFEKTTQQLTRIDERITDIVVNIKDFGASEDADDNTLAIQNAIDYVSESGVSGRVLVPGSYKYSSNIHLKSGVNLTGDKLICTSNENGKIIFYNNAELSLKEIEFGIDYNDVAVEFLNTYLVPYDEDGYIRTGKIETLFNKTKLVKPFNINTTNAIGIRLWSIGRVTGETYSGFWGGLFEKPYFLGFNTCVVIKTTETDNGGWVNGNIFNDPFANEFVNFYRVEIEGNTQGVDFNVFKGASLQAQEYTEDLFIDGPNGTTIVEDLAVWDLRFQPNAKVGNIRNIKGFRDFESVPKQRYAENIIAGYYYLLGRFTTIDTSLSHCTLKVISPNFYSTEIYISGNNTVEIRNIGRRDNIRDDNIRFYYKDLSDGTREIYISSDRDLYATYYFESLRGFAPSSRERYDEVPGLTEITDVVQFGGFKGVLARIDSNISIPNNTDTAVPWDIETYNIGDIGRTRTSFIVPKGVRRVRLSAGVQFAAQGSNFGRHRIRILKNGITYSGTPRVDLHTTYGGAPLSTTLQSAIIDVNEGDYFELIINQITGESVSLQHSEANWFAMEVIE